MLIHANVGRQVFVHGKAAIGAVASGNQRSFAPGVVVIAENNALVSIGKPPQVAQMVGVRIDVADVETKDGYVYSYNNDYLFIYFFRIFDPEFLVLWRYLLFE